MQERESSDGTTAVAPGRAAVATAAAYGIACLVHLLTAGLLTGGLLLVVLGLDTVVQPVVGLVMLGLAGCLRPRFAGLAPDLPTLRRAEAPVLYALLDRIADEVGVRRLDAVQISADFTVEISAYGIRRRRKLALGLPLWLTLTPQERIAAIAHELGHFASGDIRRGVWVSTALASLAAGAELAEGRPSKGDAHLATSATARWADQMAEATAHFNARGQVANLALWLPRLAARGTARLLIRLTLPGARRTEFRADIVAARTASTRAAVCALRARQLADTVDVEMHRLAVSAQTFGRAGTRGSADQDFWERLATHAAALSDRVRAAAPEAGVRAGDAGSGPADTRSEDTGLPAIDVRIARLGQASTLPAAITSEAAETKAVEDELRHPMRLLARKTIQDCVHG